MQKTFKRDEVKAGALFLADMEPSNLELISEVQRRDTGARLGIFNRTNAEEDEKYKEVFIAMTDLSVLQDDNEGVPILLNAEGEIAGVGEDCHVNPEKMIGIKKSQLYIS